MGNKKKGKPLEGKAPPPARAAVPTAPVSASGGGGAGRVAPLFRRIDWVTCGVTVLVVFAGYWLTLAPDLTLEDSGELATGSFYAGVPHPPGYPVWTLYSWLFTRLIRVGNIAWRVGISSAVAGALACGLLALVVSRGSSLMIEGIGERLAGERGQEGWRGLGRGWENGLCMVAGYVAGMLIGFNGFMWSQAVIVEVYPLSVLSLMGLLCCLMRWVYAPGQRRYLYWAAFLFGVSITNHQTLIVAAMGLEVAIAAVEPKVGRELFLFNSGVYLLGLYLKSSGAIGFFEGNLPLFAIYNVIGVGSMVACGWLSVRTGGILTEWKAVLVIAGLWCLGAGFYFYMPLASMSNPPMNWGYPRTVSGFFSALTRGQYEKTNPTSSLWTFLGQVRIYFAGAIDEFNLVYLLLGLVPFGFYRWMQKRERAWLVGTGAIYVCLAFLLLILLNPTPDRQSREQTRVFFTASHVFLSMWIGYGLALLGAWIGVGYRQFRVWGMYGSAVAAAIGLYGLADLLGTGGVPGALGWSVGLLVVAGAGALAAGRRPEWRRGLLGGSAFVAAAGLGLGARGLYQLLPMLYASTSALIVDTGLFALGLALAGVLLFGLCRRRVPLGLLLGLFALMPVHSILSHWSDNEQRHHLFGYWFGHDMFTPPFKGKDGRPLYPAMARDAILFGGTDPGRFCPTYMIFCESFIPPRCKPRDPKFDRRDVYIITQNALAEPHYLEYIRAQYFPSAEHDPYFFTELFRTQADVEDGTTNLFARLWVPVDRYFTGLGARIDRRRRAEGVYPAREIYTPSEADHNWAFTNYLAGAERRLRAGRLEPGEDVHIVGGRIQVSGQVSVMKINALLAKIIFDKNPGHEFYVEESFPLQWMYPYLSPFGIIMKVNRQPLPELTEAMIRRDHEFWTQYSARLTGNWITYTTPLRDICAFVRRVYLRRDYRGFAGDRKFIRDDDAQKAFSKLRTSIGGVYAWHLAHARTVTDRERMYKEADFAFRQAFCFCPYSPETVQRYATLLANANRLSDARLLAQTALEFDPDNAYFRTLARQLEGMTEPPTNGVEAEQVLQRLEAAHRANPTNLQDAFKLAGAYMQLHRSNEALALVNGLAANSNADTGTLLAAAQVYAQLGQVTRLEATLERLTHLIPDNPEVWYDLSVVRTTLGQIKPALASLTRCIHLSNQRLTHDPKAKDLRALASQDARLTRLHALPEYQRLISTK
jgi:tetratricopeptide (TPR) repeat protein